MLISCMDEGIQFDNTLKFESSYHQEKFIELLKRKEIKFKLKDDGVILYSSKDESEIKLLKMSLLDELSRYSIKFLKRDYEGTFTKKLASKGIKYKIEQRGEDRWVVWDESDDEQVQDIWKNMGSRKPSRQPA